jgi:O-6-methylguanine DNA methyltransferase
VVEVFLGPHPGVRVELTIQADSLTRVSLFSSPHFSTVTEKPSPCFDQAVAWLKAYAQGETAPYPLPLGETFRGEVLHFLQTIPRGAVFSYGQVARALGNPGAARAIGNICRTNLFPLFIPCHRIIRSDGTLGNYTPDPVIKKELLRFEGVKTFDQ